MVLNHAGFNAITYLTYSEFLYEHRESYFEILSSTQSVGDFLRLVKYFLRGMLSAAEREIERVTNLEETMLRDELKIRNSAMQVKGIYDVHNYFKQHLVSDIKSASADLGLSYNTVSKAVDLLIKVKILNIETVQVRHRKFRYTKILKLLNEM